MPDIDPAVATEATADAPKSALFHQQMEALGARFVNWRYDKDDPKRKVPMRPVKPWKRASPTDPASWSGYWACRNFADHHGMGVTLTGDQLVVVDLDGARDRRNNATSEWAKPIHRSARDLHGDHPVR